MTRRGGLLVGVVLLLIVGGWIAISVAYPVPDIRIGMTEQEVESLLGPPIQARTHEEGHGGVGVYPAVPRWLLSRNDWYVITYGADGRVAHYDRVQSGFFGTPHWTHR